MQAIRALPRHLFVPYTSSLYSPIVQHANLMLAAFMGVDMYLRLNNVIARASTVSSTRMKKAQ